jgi:acetyl esterase/lipase
MDPGSLRLAEDGDVATLVALLRIAVVETWRWLTTLKPLMVELFLPRKSTGRVLFGYGVTWFVMLARMAVFVLLLMPGFVRLVYFYVRSASLKRGIKYGPNPRNTLDVYLPENVEKGVGAPVFVFFTGGAWIIGYKVCPRRACARRAVREAEIKPAR